MRRIYLRYLLSIALLFSDSCYVSASDLYSGDQLDLLKKMGEKPEGFLIACAIASIDGARISIQEYSNKIADVRKSIDNIIKISILARDGYTGIYRQISDACYSDFLKRFPYVQPERAKYYRVIEEKYVYDNLLLIDKAIKDSCHEHIPKDSLSGIVEKACDDFMR